MDEHAITLPNHILRAALMSTVLAASTDDTRPHLYGVCISNKRTPEGSVDFVGTNAHTLHRYRTETAEDVAPGLHAMVTLPAVKALLAVPEMKKDPGGVTTITITEGRIRARHVGGRGYVDYALSPGKFPPYHKVIPLLSRRPGQHTGVDPKYLGQVSQAFKHARLWSPADSRKKGVWTDCGVIQMSTGFEKIDPIVFFSDHHPGAALLCVVMPRRI